MSREVTLNRTSSRAWVLEYISTLCNFHSASSSSFWRGLAIGARVSHLRVSVCQPPPIFADLFCHPPLPFLPVLPPRSPPLPLPLSLATTLPPLDVVSTVAPFLCCDSVPCPPLPTVPRLCLPQHSQPQPRRRVSTTAWQRKLSPALGRSEFFCGRFRCCASRCCRRHRCCHMPSYLLLSWLLMLLLWLFLVVAAAAVFAYIRQQQSLPSLLITAVSRRRLSSVAAVAVINVRRRLRPTVVVIVAALLLWLPTAAAGPNLPCLFWTR